jgi:hypothetical protein
MVIYRFVVYENILALFYGKGPKDQKEVNK